MKWFKLLFAGFLWFELLFAGFYSLTMIHLVHSAAMNYREMSQYYREESRGETTSPDRGREARIYRQLYSSVQEALDSIVKVSLAIVFSALVAMSAIQGFADRRIRALEEEVKRLRTLVSGNPRQGV